MGDSRTVPWNLLDEERKRQIERERGRIRNPLETVEGRNPLAKDDPLGSMFERWQERRDNPYEVLYKMEIQGDTPGAVAAREEALLAEEEERRRRR